MLHRSEQTAQAPSAARSPAAVALAGLVALAVAMGIGRFAFTPILPMMQEDAGLSVAAGGWLASANYIGYLFGALSAMVMRVRAARAIRGGLVLIGVVTLGMALEHRFAGWIVLRTLAGIANAWVAVFALAWCLEKLAAARRPLLNGLVFAGVGTGIAVVGGFCLVLMQVNASSAQAWIALGILSLTLTAVIWPTLGMDDDASSGDDRRSTERARSWDAESVRFVLCFGATGFGYIIPATFLPVMARQLIRDPLVFGWSWPLFGAAAAASTLAAAVAPRFVGNRRLWMLSQLVMALGVALPIVWRGIAGIMLAALFVGSTFMVITMVAMQEAQKVAGRHATGLIAAMTSAFAAGQIAGPISVSYVVGASGNFSEALLAACLLLATSAYALSHPRAAGGATRLGLDQPYGPVATNLWRLVRPRNESPDWVHTVHGGTPMNGKEASSKVIAQDRMPPISTENMTKAQQKVAAELASGPRGGVRGPFIPLLRSPELMDRLQKVGEYLRYHSALDAKLNEFVMLITSREWTQQFEWAVHAPLAIKAGLKPETVKALADGRRPTGMAEDEEIVYGFCDELFRTHGVSETTYQCAVTKFGEQGVIDMLGVVGYFTTVSMVMNVAHTPPPDNTLAPLASFPL